MNSPTSNHAHQKIPVRIAQTGQTLNVVAFDKRVDHLIVVPGEAMHRVMFEQTLTTTAAA
jgi:hypothetical protein